MEHKGTVTLETERLILRRAAADDCECMFRNWDGDERVTKYLTWAPYKSAEELRGTYLQHLLDSYEKPDFYDWLIVLKEIGEPVGAIGAVNLQEDIEALEVGYCLGVNWWHKGIMTEALGRVIEFFFEEVGVNRIASRHDPRNPHSGDVMKKCGLRYEGTARQADKNNQGVCDAAYYAILREDYLS